MVDLLGQILVMVATSVPPSVHPDSLRKEGESPSLTLSEYANLTGLSVKTVRKKIKQGKISAVLVDGPYGLEYRLDLEGQTPFPARLEGVSSLEEAGSPSEEEESPSPNGVTSSRALVIIDRITQELTQLQNERAELYGRLGFLQAQLQAAQARILELEAPKEASTEIANHLVPEQNGQDSAAETVAEMPEQQLESGGRPEASTPPAADGQDAVASGPFKRFWRWLSQPV